MSQSEILQSGEKGLTVNMDGEKARNLLESQHLAVLCTQGDKGPYASLMAYVYDRKADAVFLVTRKDSEKYRNMMRDSRVALLIDDRCNAEDPQAGFISSLTVQGHVAPYGLCDADSVRQWLRERFSPLQALLLDPESIVLRVILTTYLLLEGPEKAVRGAFRHDANRP